MSLSSWGNFPRIISNIIRIRSIENAESALDCSHPIICYGNGRSYGDCALGNTQLDMRRLNKFIAFDTDSGILETESGVLIDDILDTFIPRLWNLAIVPGTKLITIGGAIASDVHGKNHHVKGCFSNSVLSLKLLLPNSQLIKCSRTQNQDLFHATCGGQGLTGIIVSAKIQLDKIASCSLDVTTLKASNLKQVFTQFEENSDSPYSVAWIDCCAQNDKLGRGLVSLASFSEQSNLLYSTPSKLSVPFYFPNFALNKWVVQIFNSVYYHRVRKQRSITQKSIDSFFFPLDRLRNWNRIYGKKGFVQYQFILPLSNSYAGMLEILKRISKSKRSSFLAVLKLHGPENKNFLSFPYEGYSLALDFKIAPGVFDFLNELDQLVLQHQGRIYLAKDARMPKEVFDAGYPRANEFRKLRSKVQASNLIHSKQSERLKL